LDLLPAIDGHVHPERVEVADGVLGGHLGNEDLLIAPRHLRVAVTVIRRDKKLMPGISGDLRQAPDRFVRLGDAESGYIGVLLLA
jgi:hypothetical protein